MGIESTLLVARGEPHGPGLPSYPLRIKSIMKLDVEAVVKILNQLKVRRKLKDYAIFGAVASTYYIEPIYTEDIDIMVYARTDLEYISIWRELAKFAKKKLDFGFIISDTRVQIQPTSTHPIYESALRNAKVVRIGNIRTKIVDREHLILLALRASREKDIYKAGFLLKRADRDYLNLLLERFDADGSLKKRLQRIL